MTHDPLGPPEIDPDDPIDGARAVLWALAGVVVGFVIAALTFILIA